MTNKRAFDWLFFTFAFLETSMERRICLGPLRLPALPIHHSPPTGIFYGARKSWGWAILLAFPGVLLFFFSRKEEQVLKQLVIALHEMTKFSFSFVTNRPRLLCISSTMWGVWSKRAVVVVVYHSFILAEIPPIMSHSLSYFRSWFWLLCVGYRNWLLARLSLQITLSR